MPIPDFLIYATLSALAIASIAGPLGSFVVWQRLAYFGDTLAHGALLGVALGIFAEINITLAIVICSLSIAGLLLLQQRSQRLGGDAVLGLISHTALAAGLVCISLLGSSVDLFAYLLGDLLTTSRADLLLISGVSISLLIALTLLWRPLLLTVIDSNLAQAEGIRVNLMHAFLLFAVALVVAFAMRVVGVLLITALLIIPASAARRLASTPEMMAALAAVIGCLAVLGGLTSSYWYNTPAGPSIVLCASAIFILTLARRVR